MALPAACAYAGSIDEVRVTFRAVVLTNCLLGIVLKPVSIRCETMERHEGHGRDPGCRPLIEEELKKSPAKPWMKHGGKLRLYKGPPAN